MQWKTEIPTTALAPVRASFCVLTINILPLHIIPGICEIVSYFDMNPLGIAKRRTFYWTSTILYKLDSSSSSPLSPLLSLSHCYLLSFSPLLLSVFFS